MLRRKTISLLMLAALIVQPVFATGGSLNFSPRRDLLGKKKLRRDAVGERIVGGTAARRGRYPYVVSLRYPRSKQHYCGGVLIEEDIVLTAAHCVTKEANPLIVIGSTWRDFEKDDDAEVRIACRTIRHQRFERAETGFDIALIQLNETSTKPPIGSLDVGSIGDQTGTVMTAIGWGRIFKNGPFAEELQEIDTLEYMSNKACDGVFEDEITETMLCALDKGRDTCQGDSGGPLIWTGGDREEDTLMGLTSFGSKECDGEYPGVYTRISIFQRWIRDRGNSLLDVVTDGPAAYCKGVEEPPPPVPQWTQIMERISEHDTKGAAKLILLTTEFGKFGKEQLSIATDKAAEQCEGLELTKAFNLAIKNGKADGQKGVSKFLKPYLSKLADADCDLPLPKAKGVVAKIADGDKIDARDNVITLLKLGDEGMEVLEEVLQASAEDCTVPTYGAVLTDAVELLGIDENGLGDMFESVSEAIDACAGPRKGRPKRPPEPPPKRPPKPPLKRPPKRPPKPSTPSRAASPARPPAKRRSSTKDAKELTADDVVARLAEDDVGGAVDYVVELLESADGELVLEKVLVLAVDEGLERILGRVLNTAVIEHRAVRKSVKPYLTELLELVSIADLVDMLLKGDIEEAADEVVSISTDKILFPSLASRKRVLHEATKTASAEAIKAPGKKKIERIRSILILAKDKQANPRALDSAIDVFLLFIKP